jgi:hypothetical protein
MAALRPRLRHDIESPLFGAPCEISERVLPTYKDVLKYVLFEREKERNIIKSDPSIKQIVSVVTDKMIRIWNSASIPCVSIAAVTKRILKYYSEYQTLMKSIKSRKNVPSFKKKCDNFKNNAETQLFDISACKCEKFENCTCSKEKKVPLLEQVFLSDQRTLRKMAIGNVDEFVSKKNLRRAVRNNREQISSQSSSSTDKLELISISSSTDTESNVTDEEVDYQIPVSIKRNEASKSVRPKTPAKRIKLSEFALACDRTGVSDRAAALLTSAIISDITPINKDGEPSLVFDRSKVRRERVKM